MKNTIVMDALLRDGLLNDSAHARAQSLMRQNDRSEIYALSALGLLENQEILQAVCTRYGLQTVSLSSVQIPHEALRGLSADVLYPRAAIPFGFADDAKRTLCLAMADPTDAAAADDVSAYTARRVIPYLSPESDIRAAIAKAFGDDRPQTASSRTNEDTAVRIVEEIVSAAVRARASDIHMEGLPDCMRVRYRVDGVLYERDRFPLSLFDAAAARIKILAGLDIAQRRIPQDGKYTAKIDGNEYDIRVSVMPTLFGEKCELRIAPKQMLFHSIKDLGVMQEDLPAMERLFSAANGMVLITGPTGCGKTTTLYSALTQLNRQEVNILTVEDPVEITIPGVNQIQLSPQAGLTFSSVLRSILRQDPNIIMLGEIRDAETAKTAVQASITGHLVLSTLHTNSSVGAVNRLVNMGVERYLLSDALTGVVSQRLVRRLCPHCKRQYTPDQEALSYLRLPYGTTLYEPVGCEKCGGSGYLGRTGVYEILEISSDLRRIISSHDFDTKALAAAAQANGMRSLFAAAAELVRHGETSVQEIGKQITRQDETI